MYAFPYVFMEYFNVIALSLISTHTHIFIYTVKLLRRPSRDQHIGAGKRLMAGIEGKT